MATQKYDQRTVAVEVSQAEMNTLLVDKAKAAGFIDFDPTSISIMESPTVPGSFDIVFEKKVEA